MKFYILSSLLLAVAAAQQYTTPVPILKQINKHNEDGSYSYGYEAADGSYKIETKYQNGEVYGKYGYVDDQGKLREIEYGATKRGFEPAGNEINVPPPTLKNNNDQLKPLGPNEEDDGQYREDPSVYYKNEEFNNNNNVKQTYTRPAYQNYVEENYQPTYQQPAKPAYKPQTYQQPAYQPQQTYQQPAYQPQQTYQQPAYQPQQTYQQPAYQPQQTNQQPAFRPTTRFNFGNSQPQYQGHPATNVDYSSGSYSVNY